MPRKGKKEYVVHKSVRLPIYPYRDTRTGAECWRFAWPDESAKGGWRYGTRAGKQAAREAAHAKAVEIASGTMDLSSITPEQARLCRSFLDLSPTWADLDLLRSVRVESSTTSEALSRFSAHLLAGSKTHTPHHRTTLLFLGSLAKNFPGPVQKISRDDLSEWLFSHQVGESRLKAMRAALVHFWRFCARERMLHAPDGMTAADRIRTVSVARQDSIRILSPEEARFLLASVSVEYLPWLAFSMFAPFRSEEIRPKSHHEKPPLDWSQVKTSHIELYPSQSKVRKRRLISIRSTLAAWISHIGHPGSGMVCPTHPAEMETKRLGALLDEKFSRREGWPRNILRHSALTYLAASERNLSSLAIEAGTSIAMLNSRYVEAATKKEAEDYMSLFPSDVFRMLGK